MALISMRRHIQRYTLHETSKAVAYSSSLDLAYLLVPVGAGVRCGEALSVSFWGSAVSVGAAGVEDVSWSGADEGATSAPVSSLSAGGDGASGSARPSR